MGKVVQLHDPSRLKLAEHDFTHHSLTAMIGTTFEEILAPEYWAHNAGKFTSRDEVTVRCEDGLWYGKLLVKSVEKNGVVMEVLLYKDMAGTEETPASAHPTFAITWRGPKCRFSVVRISDKGLVKDGFATREDAVKWAADHPNGAE